MEEVEVEFGWLTEEECSVPEDFVGGGREIVDDLECEDVVIIVEGVVVEGNESPGDTTVFETCEEKGGKICDKKEECLTAAETPGEEVSSKDGICCLETSRPP